MSVISAIFDQRVKSVEEAFGAKDISTQAMQEAILDWYALYYETEATKDYDPCQRIPVAVVSKLTKTTFSEYSAAPAKESRKADYAARIMLGLERARKGALQNALIGGECLLKPLLSFQGVAFNVIARRGYLVFARNETGAVTDVGTQETTEQGGRIYTLLERRTVDAGGYLTITSRLFCSETKGMLGREVPLGALEKYAELVPVNRLGMPTWSTGLIPLRLPLENCVDGSEDSVSVYAPAVGLIRNINRNEAQINGEFDRGKSRLLVSSDLMRKDGSGRRTLQDEIFTMLDEDPDTLGITIFSPELREKSFLARKAEYLRNVETVIGLKRGILSEVEAAERTAKEITSSEGDYSLTIVDLQQMWTDAVKEALRICDLLGQMYKFCDSVVLDPEKDVTIDWGNGILYDEDKAWSEYMSMVSAGMIRPEIALAWKFNIPWETPEDLAAIREKYMPELEKLDGGDE